MSSMQTGTSIIPTYVRSCESEAVLVASTRLAVLAVVLVNGGGGHDGKGGGFFLVFFGGEGGAGGSGDCEQGCGGECGGDDAQAASTLMEAPWSVCCHPAWWATTGRVLQVQSSSPNPLFLVHVPQPVSHTRMKMRSERPLKVFVPKVRLLALYSTVNFLRVVFLNAFPL